MLDRGGGCLGHVTSCVTIAGESQVGLALCDRCGIEPGTAVSFLNPSREGTVQKGASDLRSGDRIIVTARGEILPRFLSSDATPEAGGD